MFRTVLSNVVYNLILYLIATNEWSTLLGN